MSSSLSATLISFYVIFSLCNLNVLLIILFLSFVHMHYVVVQSQLPDSIESSANSTFELYLSNEPIQESWNNAQKTVSI